MGVTRPSSTSVSNMGDVASSRPRGSMMAEIPVLVDRSMNRPVSSARIRAISRCWCGASESPNQASLLALTRKAASGSAWFTSVLKASS